MPAHEEYVLLGVLLSVWPWVMCTRDDVSTRRHPQDRVFPSRKLMPQTLTSAPQAQQHRQYICRGNCGVRFREQSSPNGLTCDINESGQAISVRSLFQVTVGCATLDRCEYNQSGAMSLDGL